MSDTFRLLREAFPETLADSSVDVAIRRLQRHQAEAAKAIRDIRKIATGRDTLPGARQVGP